MMEKKQTICTRLCLLVFLCLVSTAAAAPPQISIDLALDKADAASSSPVYNLGEPIGITVTASYDADNTGAPSLLVSQGLQATDFYLNIRVLDPSGNLLLSRHENYEPEAPDAPPLRKVYYNGAFFKVKDCEVLQPGWTETEVTGDIRGYYDFTMPGWYSLQVQVFTAVFNQSSGNNICFKGDYQFQGMLKSQTRFLYIDQDTDQAKVIPANWNIKWTETTKKWQKWRRKVHKKWQRKVQVQLRTAKGENTGSYDLSSITLNYVPVVYSKALKPMVKAFFNAKEVMATLGDVQVGQQYPVNIRGLKNGAPFLKVKQVTIVGKK